MIEKRIPVSEVLAHLSDITKTSANSGRPFQCVAILFVDPDGKWAGAVGGEQSHDLAKLLLTARDSLVRGEDAFTQFVRRDDAPPINGHDSKRNAQ